MICPVCNKTFEPRAVNQKFCSRECERANMRKNYFNRDAKSVPEGKRPIGEFVCKNCGQTVFVYDRSDQRTTYCSGKCASAYQSKKAAQRRQRVRGNLGVSGGMSLSSLVWRERRDLD